MERIATTCTSSDFEEQWIVRSWCPILQHALLLCVTWLGPLAGLESFYHWTCLILTTKLPSIRYGHHRDLLFWTCNSCIIVRVRRKALDTGSEDRLRLWHATTPVWVIEGYSLVTAHPKWESKDKLQGWIHHIISHNLPIYQRLSSFCSCHLVNLVITCPSKNPYITIYI